MSSIHKSLRLAQLPELLKTKARTTGELTERFGVPQRTIQRDLETLREAGQGIVETKRGLYFIPSSTIQLNALEALAVHTAARLLFHHSPTRSHHYQSALEKLAKLLPEPAQGLAFQSAEELRQRKLDDRSLELVARAWFEGRVLTFEYRSAKGSGQWRRKELEVYFVEVNRDNLAPYAIGFERTFHKKVMTWKLSRMRNTNLLNDRYTIPESFNPKDYLSSAWGVVGTSGGPVTEVRLRFIPEAAQRLLEGDFPNFVGQIELPDGGLELSLLAGTDDHGFPLEILSWVHSWGYKVEVLAPGNLRERWKSEVLQLAQKLSAEAE